MDAPTPLACALAEIRQLHAFFEDWFIGRVPRAEGHLERVAEVLDPTFFLVSPAGDRAGRTRLLALLDESHGSRPEGFRIRVAEAEGRVVAGDHVLATYQEWHEGEGQPRGRRSTVLFRPAPGTPNGMAWLFVHETWLPSSSEDGTASGQ